MKNRWTIAFVIVIVVAAAVYSLTGEPHEFSPGDCVLCHVDEKNDPMFIRASITSACETCHEDVRETQSHPTDIYPTLSIPADMLLIRDGLFTCVTCHYVHPKKKGEFVKKHMFLRRQVRGPIFCSICHELDEKGHIVLGNVHPGKYTVTDRTASLDRMSLDCIECHDRHFKEPLDFLGSGSWEHSSMNSHPIGVSYSEASMRRMDDYHDISMIPKEVRLFDGKIGCGTCHSIYSKRKGMLVMDNTGSRLCLECHNK